MALLRCSYSIIYTYNMEQQYFKAIEAAVAAGKEIMQVYNSDDFQVEQKGDNSPLTLADRKAHIKIMAFLEDSGIPVLSEEGKALSYAERKDWNQLWIVDPLDGTKEFIKRNGEFTVNIALAEEGILQFGVIYVPVTGELYFGIKEEGAFKLAVPDSVEQADLAALKAAATVLPIKEERVFTVVASRSHLSPETEDYINELRKEHSDLEFISKGSSLKLCAVAEGKADVYPRFAPTMEWDTAAGQAIIEAMGGSVCRTDGTPLLYNREDLLNPWFIASVCL